jgi:hypothetical protein
LSKRSIGKDFSRSLTSQASLILQSLSDISELSNFTLVGGSALSIYLQHRFSEDLDFFTWLPELSNAQIDILFNRISQQHSLKIINTYSSGIDTLIDNVKVTFFANNWEELKIREKILNNSFIAKPELLTAMKINTLSLRAKYRDYYDLYVIANELFDIRQMFDISLKFLPGMTKKIFAMQIIYIEDIEDETIEHLFPKYTISLDEIRIFFEKQIKKLL